MMHSENNNEIKEEIKVSKYNTSQSQAHSRKGSVKVLKPMTMHTSDSENSPRSVKVKKPAKSVKSSSPNKSTTSKKKELSPTQKLIKFKNKTYKSKVK